MSSDDHDAQMVYLASDMSVEGLGMHALTGEVGRRVQFTALPGRRAARDIHGVHNVRRLACVGHEYACMGGIMHADAFANRMLIGTACGSHCLSRRHITSKPVHVPVLVPMVMCAQPCSGHAVWGE